MRPVGPGGALFPAPFACPFLLTSHHRATVRHVPAVPLDDKMLSTAALSPSEYDHVDWGPRVTEDDFPLKVYKWLWTEEHVDQLLNGHIWLSTLGYCRKVEGKPGIGDPYEATQKYQVTRASGNVGDPQFDHVLKHLQFIKMQLRKDVVIEDCAYIVQTPDAFLFCTCEHFNPEAASGRLGIYCVEITGPLQFAKRLSEALLPITRGHEKIVGRVTYGEPDYRDQELPLGPLGFVKRPDEFADQVEFRMLFKPLSKNMIERRYAHVPAVVAQVRLVRSPVNEPPK
jgi:hypothetical protein